MFSQIFHEKVSNFGRMFRCKINELSWKFKLAKFKVANFQGNQTEIHDSEIQATDFLDMSHLVWNLHPCYFRK